MFLNKLFKKPNSKRQTDKPTAIAFVDFEHWYISLDKIYKTKPEIRRWRDSLQEKYDLVDILFFGDFSNPSLRNEINQIREVSNFIVDTQNASSHYKKDFTDFIMLDHIYQRALSDAADVFIIFTGDGHFNSVVQFLVNKCKKEVGVYGVKNAISNQLKLSASWYEEAPDEGYILRYYDMILENIRRIETSYRPSRATFMKTVAIVAQRNNVSEDQIRMALESLMQEGYVEQKRERAAYGGKTINVLKVNWTKLKEDHVFPR